MWCSSNLIFIVLPIFGAGMYVWGAMACDAKHRRVKLREDFNTAINPSGEYKHPELTDTETM